MYLCVSVFLLDSPALVLRQALRRLLQRLLRRCTGSQQVEGGGEENTAESLPELPARVIVVVFGVRLRKDSWIRCLTWTCRSRWQSWGDRRGRWWRWWRGWCCSPTGSQGTPQGCAKVVLLNLEMFHRSQRCSPISVVPMRKLSPVGRIWKIRIKTYTPHLTNYVKRIRTMEPQRPKDVEALF